MLAIRHQVLLPGEILMLQFAENDLQNDVQKGAKVIVQQRNRSGSVGCVASILSRQKNGHLKGEVVVVRGLHRARLLDVDESSCRANCFQISDYYAKAAAPDRNQMRRELLVILEHNMSAGLQPLCSAGLRHELSLGELCDLTTRCLQLNFVERGQLLQESDVDARCAILLTHALGKSWHGGVSMPLFSDN